MKTKMTLTTAVLAGGTILAMQALAQMPSQVPAQLPGAITAPNSTAAAGSMLKGATPSGCQGLIDQASSLVGLVQGGLKTSILGELSQAKSSLSAGNQATCLTHANKAMTMLK